MDNKEEKTNIPEEALEEVNGGFCGSDKYSAAEYSRWGISWEHRIFDMDTYMFLGKKITQSDAEKIVELSRSLGRVITEKEYVFKIKGWTWAYDNGYTRDW